MLKTILIISRCTKSLVCLSTEEESLKPNHDKDLTSSLDELIEPVDDVSLSTVALIDAVFVDDELDVAFE
jgi:hypothetical protein